MPILPLRTFISPSTAWRRGIAGGRARRSIPIHCLPETRRQAKGAAALSISETGMKISGVDIRPGNIIEYEGGIWRAVKIQHAQPGKGGAYMQVELKNLVDGG